MASKPAALQRAATAPVLASAEAFRGRTPGTSPVRRAATTPGGGKRALLDREQGRSPSALLARAAATPAALAALALLSLLACAALPSLLGDLLAAEEAVGPGTGGPGLPRSTTPGLLRKQNRRMALETASITQTTATKAPAAPVAALEIEYREAGHRVPLAAALDPSRWAEPPIYDASAAVTDPQALDALLEPLRRPADAALSAHCPQGLVRVFVAIMSRCCVPSARAKRDAIRSGWLGEVRGRHSDAIAAAWMVSQPGGDAAGVAAAAAFLEDEVRRHGDIVVLPGTEDYFKLVDKTLGMLRYALSSPCRFTHLLKTDDDVVLRPERLLEAIRRGERAFDLPVQAPPAAPLAFDGRRYAAGNVTFDGAAPPQGPWMRGMYLGKVDFNVSETFPGWRPIRLRTSKWYLPAEALPDGDAPLGVRWASGWGYLMSRDVAEAVWDGAVRQASLDPSVSKERAPWWGRLPWEDVAVAALLAGPGNGGEKVVLSHHDGFKAAWDGCDPGTVLKHLDNDAPALTAGLAAQAASGLWAAKEVVCSSGPFVPGQYAAWREWRNRQSDSLANGFILALFAAQRASRARLASIMQQHAAEQGAGAAGPSPWWARLRWRATSHGEALADERALLALAQTPLDQRDVAFGPGRDDYLHTIVGGAANAASPHLVYVPGYGAGSGFLFRAMQGLAAGFRLTAVDPWGTGLSGRPPFPAATTAEAEAFFVDSLEKWRAAAGIDRMVLLGHSMGGYISACYALRHPDRVAHLIMVCPAGVGRRPADWQPPAPLRSPWTWKGQLYRAAVGAWNAGVTPGAVIRAAGPWGRRLVEGYTRSRFQSRGHHLTEEEVRAFQSYMYHVVAARGSGEHALNKILEPFAFPRAPLEDRLHACAVPVTFIYGAHDWMDPKAAARVCEALGEEPGRAKVGGADARLAPSDRRVIFTPNAGHYPFIDQPGTFLENVLEACEGYLPAAAAVAVRQAAAARPFLPQPGAAADTREEMEAEMEANPAAAETRVATDM